MFSFLLLIVYCITTTNPSVHYSPPFGFHGSSDKNVCGTSENFLLEKHGLRLDTCAVLCLTATVNCTGFDYRENSRHCILRNGTSSNNLEVCPQGVQHYQRACIYGDAPYSRYYFLGETWTDNDCSCQCEMDNLEATCICGSRVDEQSFYRTPFGIMLICISAAVWFLLFCGCCLLWRVIEAQPENDRFSTMHIGSLEFPTPYASPSIGSFDSLSPDAVGVGVPPFKVILPSSSVETPKLSHMKVSISQIEKSKNASQDRESLYVHQFDNKDSNPSNPDPLLDSWNAAYDARYGDANDASTSPAASDQNAFNYRSSKSI